MHSYCDLTISGGVMILQAGDDGIHADNMLLVTDGEITVTESYEGLEGTEVYIEGGYIDITSSDDGINAAGGADNSGFGGFRDSFSSSTSSTIVISGGVIYVNASGDGIDSNGTLYITGGETYVSGPTDSMNGAIDFETEGTITGGILVALSYGGMEESFGSASTQGVMSATVTTQQAGSAVTVTDSDGNVLATFESPDKSYCYVTVSCPELTVGETYTITAGSSSTSVTMTSLITGGNSWGNMTMGGMTMGNMGTVTMGGMDNNTANVTTPDAGFDSGMNVDANMGVDTNMGVDANMGNMGNMSNMGGASGG